MKDNNKQPGAIHRLFQWSEDHLGHWWCVLVAAVILGPVAVYGIYFIITMLPYILMIFSIAILLGVAGALFSSSGGNDDGILILLYYLLGK